MTVKIKDPGSALTHLYKCFLFFVKFRRYFCYIYGDKRNLVSFCVCFEENSLWNKSSQISIITSERNKENAIDRETTRIKN